MPPSFDNETLACPQQLPQQQKYLRSHFDRFSAYHPMQQAGSVFGLVLKSTSQVLQSHTVRKTLATGLRTSARAIRSEIVTKRISSSLETVADAMEEGTALDHLATAVGSLSGALSDYVENYSHDDARQQKRRWEALQVASGALGQSMQSAMGFAGRVVMDERMTSSMLKLTSVSLGVIDHVSQSQSAARIHDMSVGMAHKIYTNETCRRAVTAGTTTVVAVMQSPASMRSKAAMRNAAQHPAITRSVNRVVGWSKTPRAQTIASFFASATSATIALLMGLVVAAMDAAAVPVLWGRRVLNYLASMQQPASSHKWLATCIEKESKTAKKTPLSKSGVEEGDEDDDVAKGNKFSAADAEYLDRLLRDDREARRALIRLHLQAVEREKEE